MSLSLEGKHSSIEESDQANLDALFVNGRLRFNPAEQKLPENLAIIRGQAALLCCDKESGIKIFYNQANNLYFTEMPPAFSSICLNGNNLPQKITKITDMNGYTADYLVDDKRPDMQALWSIYKMGRKKDVNSTRASISKLLVLTLLGLFAGGFISKNVYDTFQGNPPAIIRSIQQAVSRSRAIKVEPMESEPLESSEGNETQ